MIWLMKKLFGGNTENDKSTMMIVLCAVLAFICVLSVGYTMFSTKVHKEAERALNTEISQLNTIVQNQEKEIAQMNIIVREKDEQIQTMSRLSNDIMRNTQQYRTIAKQTDKAVDNVLKSYDVTEAEGTHGTKWEDAISEIRYNSLWRGFCLNNPNDIECKEKGK